MKGALERRSSGRVLRWTGGNLSRRWARKGGESPVEPSEQRKDRKDSKIAKKRSTQSDSSLRSLFTAARGLATARRERSLPGRAHRVGQSTPGSPEHVLGSPALRF